LYQKKRFFEEVERTQMRKLEDATETASGSSVDIQCCFAWKSI